LDVTDNAVSYNERGIHVSSRGGATAALTRNLVQGNSNTGLGFVEIQDALYAVIGPNTVTVTDNVVVQNHSPGTAGLDVKNSGSTTITHNVISDNLTDDGSS